MNLIQFHEAVQTGSEELSQEQLQNLVRLLALEVPEAERSAFLEVMLEARKRREAVQLPELASGVRSEVVTRVREILPRLKEIATGERGLDSTVDWDVTETQMKKEYMSFCIRKMCCRISPELCLSFVPESTADCMIWAGCSPASSCTWTFRSRVSMQNMKASR